MSDLDPEPDFVSERVHWSLRWRGVLGLLILAALLVIGSAVWSHRMKSSGPGNGPPTILQ